MKKHKPTIAAIANEANVSPATVSRVINHRNLVNESTIQQVEDAMLRLGIAVNEKKKINNEKKVILFSRETGNTTFYDQICKGILKSTQANGYHLIVNYDSINRGNIGDFIMLLKRANVSGLILSSFLSEDLLDALNAVVPIVQCCEFNENSSIPYVSIDDYNASRQATRYLITSGRNKIAFINGPQNQHYAKERLRGFLDTIYEDGISIPSSWIAHVPSIDYNLAYTIICQILNSDIRPNAFFAVSDILAAAAINACNRFHLRVPEDVMVMGFDNGDICTMIRPSITTVSQPKFQLGYTASEILIDLLHNSNTNARNLLLSTELIIRESATSLGNEIASPTSKT